jgi:hypothetical protein
MSNTIEKKGEDIRGLVALHPQFGQLFLSFGVLHLIPPGDTDECLRRHLLGDGVDLQNSQQVDMGTGRENNPRSVYRDRRGTEFCIETDANGSTSVMLASEYREFSPSIN